MESSLENSPGALSPPKRLVHLHGPSVPSTLFEKLNRDFQRPSFMRWLIYFGAVYVNRERVRNPSHLVDEGDTLRIHLNPKRYVLDCGIVRKRILAETENFYVIDKPSGLPMHATLDNFFENLMRAFDQKVFITHRLDVPTSGLVILAKNALYQKIFNSLIYQRKVTKLYQAWVAKPQPIGILRHWMKVSVKAPKEIMKSQPLISVVETPSHFTNAEAPRSEKWDECVLEVLNCQQGATSFYELLIKLHTGRTHQIRAQLAAEENPIIGDEMYGGSGNFFGLHACRLEFYCPWSDFNFRFEKTLF